MNKAQQNALELSKATALLQQGRFAEAIPVYEAILRREPKNISAANLLGISLMQMGKLQEATVAIQKSLLVNDSQPSAHYNLGTILQALGRHGEAIVHYQKVLAQNPNDAQCNNNLGVALKAVGRLEESADAYRKAIAVKPDFAEAYANLAAALISLERYDEAIEMGEKALIYNANLSEAHLNIGNALRVKRRFTEALKAFDRVIKLQPGRAEGYICAGDVLMAINFEDRAIDHFRKAALLKPKSAAIRFKLATCLYSVRFYEEAAKEAQTGFSGEAESVEDHIAIAAYLQLVNRHDQALIHFEKALVFDSNSEPALLGRAITLGILHRHAEALQQFDKLLERRPDDSAVQSNRALASLYVGHFREGWKFYNARFSDEVRLSPAREYSIPRWGGEICSRLIVWGEQGLGDQILYSSMIPDVVERVGAVLLDVEPRLVTLLARSFPKIKVRSLKDGSNSLEADAHIPIGGLGEFFRLNWSAFPRNSYLVADMDRVEGLRKDLPNEKPIMGISWRSANVKLGEHKTAALSDFTSAFSSGKFNFVNLQYGDTAAEIADIRKKTGIEIKHLDEIDNTKDIDGLAALIEACDVVLTVSNTTAHIAGALGKPVWILVPHGQGRHWYWFSDRKDSPWYPGARIIRQQPGQSWGDVVALLAPEILEFAQNLKAGR